MKGFPFVVGTDIVQISRFQPQGSLYRIQRLARRILHPAELSYLEHRLPKTHALLREDIPFNSTPNRILCNGKSRSEQQLLQNSPEISKLRSWLAGRWAAKEAARKAWGAEIIGYKDVRVEVTKSLTGSSSASVSIVCEPYSGSPKDTVDNVAASSVKDSPESEPPKSQLWQEGALSISHDGDYVVATVIAEPLDRALRDIFTIRTEQAREAVTSSSP